MLQLAYTNPVVGCSAINQYLACSVMHSISVSLQIDRQDLVHELNISYRDVRILDPLVRLAIPRSWAAVKQRPHS